METRTSVLDRDDLDEPQDYVTPNTEGRRGRQLIIAFVALAVIAVGALWLSRSGTSDTSTNANVSPKAATAQSQPTPSEIAAADAKLKEQMANGWVPFGGAASVDGTPVPSPAWVKWDPHPDPKSVSAGGGRPVYDQPNGTIVGYSYPGLGYVSKATVDSGKFNPSQARIAKFGCDPKTDDACREKLSKQVANGG